MKTKINTDSLSNMYYQMKNNVIDSGFEREIEWQSLRSPDDFSESDLLREIAWVILCSGFNEAVIRKKFSYISLCFCDWESAEEIFLNSENCKATALRTFNNESKIDAIIKVAGTVLCAGFDDIKGKIIEEPISTLIDFPYIGKVTALHLAKNLGFPVAKPDRHLVRMAGLIGYCDVQDMCNKISTISGDPIQVVDIVLWRFSTLKRESGTSSLLNGLEATSNNPVYM